MASSTSSSPQPKLGIVAVGVLVVVLIAAVIGIDFLPNPYYAIAHVVIYAGLVAVIATKLRTCLRLAQGTEYLSKIHGINFWIVLSVFGVMVRLKHLFGTEDRDDINSTTRVAVLLALLYSLQLVEQLLKRGAASSKLAPDAGTGAEAVTPPNPPLQQTGPA